MCSWIERINIIKMTILSKAIHGFNAIPNKILMTFFSELEEIILKFIWEHKRLWRAKLILRKKNKIRGVIVVDFKLHYKAKIIKTVWHWHKIQTQRSMERAECPEGKPHSMVNGGTVRRGLAGQLQKNNTIFLLTKCLIHRYDTFLLMFLFPAIYFLIAFSSDNDFVLYFFLWRK